MKRTTKKAAKKKPRRKTQPSFGKLTIPKSTKIVDEAVVRQPERDPED